MKPLGLAALVLFFGVAGLSNRAAAASVHKVTFESGASSTGWIDFEYQSKKNIFIPAKINGHETKVLLVTGLPISDVDKTFAASIGLRPENASRSSVSAEDHPASLIHGLTIQIGNLTLQNTNASVVDFTALSHHIGHELPFMLGDDAFNDLVVDIDFAHHRIAFSDPAHQTKPDGAIEVPLTRIEDTPLIPVSIEGAPPAEFEMGIGNSGDILVYQSYYESHKLLEGRLLSKRLAIGSGGIAPEPVGVLKRAEFAGFTFTDMPAAFIPSSLAGTKSDIIAGDLGLPVLTRFRLIIDYSHNRLYAIPNARVLHDPFARDRLGLWLNKKGADVVVEFVAPSSPAQAAGFKIGDKVALIDGKAAQAWAETALADLRYRASGTKLVFTMQDGSDRKVKFADYF
jgi:Aspartyl protease